MTKYKLEYIWLDGYMPVPNLRGKTQIKEYSSFPSLEELPSKPHSGNSSRPGKELYSLISVLPRRFGTGV